MHRTPSKVVISHAQPDGDRLRTDKQTNRRNVGHTPIVIGELYTTKRQGAPITIDVPSLSETAWPAGLDRSACGLALPLCQRNGRGLDRQTNN